MDRRTLTTAIKAAGGRIEDRDNVWTCYALPLSRESWFYELRDRIPFCSLAYGERDGVFLFGVFWDNPRGY